MYDKSQVCYLEEIGTPRCHFGTYFLFEHITINKTTATRNPKKLILTSSHSRLTDVHWGVPK